MTRAPVAFGLPTGAELHIKRDDCTGFVLGGNKVRKLEFAFAEALDVGADCVVTAGGVQSNHSRATAVAARQLGLDVTLILRLPDPASPPAPTGNLLIDKLVGADVEWVTLEQWRDRDSEFDRVEARLREQGRKPYRIPVGGSNGIGALGYVNAAVEIESQLDDTGGEPYDAIVVACGSGGTAAGLRLGAALTDRPIARRIIAFAVCDSEAHFQVECATIEAESRDRLGIADADDKREVPLIVNDRFIGPGYATPYPEMMRTLATLARTEGVILDPVYTGKAYHGLMTLLKDDSDSLFGTDTPRILFIHTGGVFGLMPPTQLEALLPYLDA